MLENLRSKLFTLSGARTLATPTGDCAVLESNAVNIRGMNGASGKKIALFVGGGFVAAIVIFYLIANWDYIGNGFLCFAQNVAGMKVHYHFPMRGGDAYPGCQSIGEGSQGSGDGDNS